MASSHSVVLYDPHRTDPEALAVAGFLAGYGNRTREAYTVDLRQSYGWCESHGLGLFDARRTDIEVYARQLEELGRAKATIARRLSTIAGFYRYAAEEALIEHSPAVHVRRPRLDYESHAVGLDRNELGAFLVAAGLGSPQDHALNPCWHSTGYGSPRPSRPDADISRSPSGVLWWANQRLQMTKPDLRPQCHKSMCDHRPAARYG